MPKLPDEHIEIKFAHLPKGVQRHLLETGQGPSKYIGPAVKMREFQRPQIEQILRSHGLVANEHSKAYPLLRTVHEQLKTHSVKIVDGNIHLERKTNFEFGQKPGPSLKDFLAIKLANPEKSGMDPIDKILRTRKSSSLLKESSKYINNEQLIKEKERKRIENKKRSSDLILEKWDSRDKKEKDRDESK
ncbi:hypothetical protein HY989_06215 [Candidatus Micrarchaeota archaeon]|nr:hypothetical protein [Candidatus Micrarchaeota archaeon]